MENDIPKIDLPDNWVIGKLTQNDISLLSLYANYPCRLKAGIFAFCRKGDIEASLNLTRYRVKANTLITIQPGTILQIHKVEGDVEIYFMGFSSDFINRTDTRKPAIDIHYAVKDYPIIEIKEQRTELLEDYFSLLLKVYETFGPSVNEALLNHLLSGILIGLNVLYKDKPQNKVLLSRAEQISKNFNRLVMQNYTTQRSVAWYAQQLQITQAHLSTIVKQTTGKTCMEIITSMVIMDA